MARSHTSSANKAEKPAKKKHKAAAQKALTSNKKSATKNIPTNKTALAKWKPAQEDENSEDKKNDDITITISSDEDNLISQDAPVAHPHAETRAIRSKTQLLLHKSSPSKAITVSRQLQLERIRNETREIRQETKRVRNQTRKLEKAKRANERRKEEIHQANLEAIHQSRMEEVRSDVGGGWGVVGGTVKGWGLRLDFGLRFGGSGTAGVSGRGSRFWFVG